MKILELLKPKQYQIIKLAKDATLFKEGDFCESIGIIILGKVKISSFLVSGQEVIYNELKENEIFGNNLIFSSEPYYKGDIIALEDCEIARINRQELLSILTNNKDFLIEYLKIQSNFGKSLNDKIKLLSIDSAQERLYYYLHIHNEEVSYNSISDLSKHLSLSREATSRLISSLVKQNKIRKTKNSIKII